MNNIIIADIPEKWIREGVSNPSVKCRNTTNRIISQIHKEYGILPDESNPSIEGGVMLSYYNKSKLLIEIYNTDEICCLVRNQNKVTTIDIESEERILTFIKEHYMGDEE